MKNTIIIHNSQWITFLSLLVSIVFLNSCASSYKLIEPQKLNYIPFNEDSNISISFNYNALHDSKNARYAKSEDKNNFKVLAVKVANKSSLPITFSNNVNIFSNNSKVLPLAPEYVSSHLKQPSYIYLLYSLGMVWSKKCNGADCSTTVIPFGLPIAVGNLIMSSNANKKFLQDMRQNDILTKAIYPGETAYGLVALPISELVTLRFEGSI